LGGGRVFCSDVRWIRRFGYTAFIILWLLTILVWAADSELHRAMPVFAWVEVKTLRDALASYADDVGSNPTPSQGLQALRVNPGEAGWKGPYLRENLPLDPWGRAYIYRFDERGVAEILTLGRDGKSGGMGENRDISSLHLDPPSTAYHEDVEERLMRIFAFRLAPVCFVGYLLAPSVVRRFRRAA
jgi:general secretion pathway protein G